MILKIVDIQLEHLRRRLQERRIGLEFSEAAKKLLAEKGYDPVYGARPLKRTIQQEVQNPLALKILEGQFLEGDTILVDVNDKGEFTFTKK